MKSDSNAGLVLAIGPFALAFLLVLTFPFSMWAAWVAMTIWNWFPAVYFHLAPLSFWMAMGLIYAAGSFRRVVPYKDHVYDWKAWFSTLTLGPAITLGLAWFVHSRLR